MVVPIEDATLLLEMIRSENSILRGRAVQAFDELSSRDDWSDLYDLARQDPHSFQWVSRADETLLQVLWDSGDPEVRGGALRSLVYTVGARWAEPDRVRQSGLPEKMLDALARGEITLASALYLAEEGKRDSSAAFRFLERAKLTVSQQREWARLTADLARLEGRGASAVLSSASRAAVRRG